MIFDIPHSIISIDINILTPNCGNYDDRRNPITDDDDDGSVKLQHIPIVDIMMTYCVVLLCGIIEINQWCIDITRKYCVCYYYVIDDNVVLMMINDDHWQ